MMPAEFLLLTPMPEEFAALAAEVQDATPAMLPPPLSGLSGRIAGRRVLLVQIGIGKVAAALATTLLLQQGRPEAILVVGVAGALDPSLTPGDLLLAERVLCFDYGSLIEGDLRPCPPGLPPLPGHPPAEGWRLPEPLRQRVAGLPGLKLGTILTGDVFLDCIRTRERLFRDLGGHAVEMEGSAVVEASTLLGGPPVLVLRAVSDLAGGGAGLDFSRFLPKAVTAAARMAAQVVARL